MMPVSAAPQQFLKQAAPGRLGFDRGDHVRGYEALAQLGAGEVNVGRRQVTGIFLLAAFVLAAGEGGALSRIERARL
jgi:hypothetical protein